MWLTDLEKLTDPKYGLNVRFEDGWKRRGASGGAQMKDVCGVLWHHDVAPRKGTYPLRGMLRDGRAGLSGPLCHIGFDRDGTVWVVGAGKANHAGKGKVSGVARDGGNTRLIGIEMTSAGTKPWDWTPEQLAAMPLLGAALSDIYGLSSSQHWAHYEYSSTGKIDPAGLPGGISGLRSRIASVRFGGGTARPNTPASNNQPSGLADVDKSQAWLAGLGYDAGPIDGKFGSKTEAATRAFQTDFGITPADGRPGPATRKEMEAAVAKIDDISKQLTDLPRIMYDASIALAGMHEGKRSTLRTTTAWTAHNHTQTHQMIAALTEMVASMRGEIAGLQKALQSVESGEPLDLDQVREAAQVGVDQALASLRVTVDLPETAQSA